MRKVFKRIFAAVMAAAMLPAVSLSVAAETAAPPLAVNESFNSYITYDQPGLDVTGRNWYIDTVGEQDKGLAVYADKGTSTIKFASAVTTDTVLSFDIKAIGSMPNGEVNLVDASNKKQLVLKYTTGKGAGAYNGLPVSGFGKNNFTNYTVVYRPTDKNYDIYINGKLKAANVDMKKPNVTSVASIEFSFSSEGGDKGVIIDNVNVYGASQKVYDNSEFPVGEYNEEEYEPVETAFGKQVGSAPLVNVDFEGGYSLYMYSGGNNCIVVEDPTNPENHCFMADKVKETDHHLNGQGLPIKSDSIIYEFDFMVENYDSFFSFTLKDSNAKEMPMARLNKGPKIVSTAGGTKSFKLMEWHTISARVDYYDRVFEVYFDGELMGKSAFTNAAFAVNTNLLESFRIHMTHYADSTATNKDHAKYYIDNFRAYEGDKLIDGDLGEIVREIDVTSKKSVFAKETPYQSMLKGFTAIHSTSGCVFVNDEKKLLKNEPIRVDVNNYLLPAEELAEMLGVPCTVNGTAVTFNNVSMTGTEHNGVIYCNDDNLINALGKIVTKVPATYNANLVVLGSMSFQLPEDQETIDLLNEYMLSYNPTPAQFDEIYKQSPLAGVHPRVQFTQADFDRMVELSSTDPNMIRWKGQVIATADAACSSALPKYERYDGTRMSVQRNLSKSIHALAVAYHITKDQKYLDRAYLELETVSKFTDWNPSHHLDTCEMMAAVAVGYDWLYNYFTPEQREVIERGVRNNGFYDSALAFQTTSSTMGSAFNATQNHGTVDNSGAFLAALAFYDAMPDVAAYIGANALRGNTLNMYQWAPDGMWFEGAGYWELAMQFTAKFISAVDTFFTNDMGWSRIDGIRESAITEMQCQTPLGVYNFADAMPSQVYVPEMMWAANLGNTEGVYSALINATNGKFANGEDQALAMLWYHPEMIEGSTSMEIDHMVESIDTLMMRNSWEAKQPYVVGVHAGQTRIPHSQLDGGSFIYEADGVRWSVDYGMGNYNGGGYFDDEPMNGKRWKNLSCRAELHSTIFTESGSQPDHFVESFADATLVESKPRGAIATVDMSELLRNVNGALRGFAFTDNRTSLVVRDEVNISGTTNVYWSMLTKATATIDEANKKVTLSQDGQTLVIDYRSSHDVTVTCDPAAALPGSDPWADDIDYTKYNLLRFTFKDASGPLEFTAKLTPASAVYTTSVDDWHKSISSWSIPEGEIPAPPRVDTITAGGVSKDATQMTSLKFTVVEGAAVPTVVATSDVYDVEIKQAGSIKENAYITVTDRNDALNKTVYTVGFDVIKAPKQFDGYTSIPVLDFEVSATPQEANPGINMFDGDRGTKWAADGIDQWMMVDFGKVQKVDEIALAFQSGHVRKQNIIISLSEDGINWTQVFAGQTCGTTEDYEFFNANGLNARFVKVDCQGNSTGGANWTSLTEFVAVRKN